MLPLHAMQIHCKGRGEAPAPAAVNDFCWELSTFAQHQQAQREFALKEHIPEPPKLYVLVHCTHGFNRTGELLLAVDPMYVLEEQYAT